MTPLGIPTTGSHAPSPLKKLPASAVPVPNLAVGTEPEPKLDAFKAVRLAPEIAGNAPVIEEADKAVRLAPEIAGNAPVIEEAEIPKASTTDLVGATPVRLAPSIAGRFPVRLPAGKLEFSSKIVPVESGNVIVLSVEVLGAVTVRTPVPEALP
jgi:hypothetical protein